MTDLKQLRERKAELERQAATTWGLDAVEMDELDRINALLARAETDHGK